MSVAAHPKAWFGCPCSADFAISFFSGWEICIQLAIESSRKKGLVLYDGGWWSNLYMVVRSDAVDSQRDAGKEIKIRKINGEWTLKLLGCQAIYGKKSVNGKWLTFCPTFSTDGEKPSFILCMLQTYNFHFQPPESMVSTTTSAPCASLWFCHMFFPLKEWMLYEYIYFFPYRMEKYLLMIDFGTL